GERQQHDAAWMDPICNEVSDTMCERIGLAGAGSSDNEKRASLGVVRATVLHSGFLLGIKIKVCSAHECAWCESNKEHIRAGHLSGSVIEAVAMWLLSQSDQTSICRSRTSLCRLVAPGRSTDPRPSWPRRRAGADGACGVSKLRLTP